MITLIVTAMIVIIVIIILEIVSLIMLVIVLKIMYVDSSVCCKKCLISFLGEEVLIIVQGNGRIYLSARWNQVLILILHSWWLLLFFNRLYLLLLASNGLCSIGSNWIVLLLPRASMLKKQYDRPAGLAQPMKIFLVLREEFSGYHTIYFKDVTSLFYYFRFN